MKLSFRPLFGRAAVMVGVIAAGLMLAVAAQAAGNSAIGLPVPLAGIDPQTLIGRVISGLLGVVGSIALVMFMYGGFVWMTAGGSQEKIKSAKGTIVWATIGLIVVFASYAIANFIINAITGAAKI